MAPTATTPEPASNTVCDPRSRLTGLLTQVKTELDQIDPDELLARHAPEIWDLCDHGAKLFTGAQLRIARRVDDAAPHKQTAARNTAEYLALRSGISNHAATEMLTTSRHLQHLPQTDTAVRAGQLSPTQAHDIATGAVANPRQETHLLNLARTASNKELRDEALRTRHAADPDPETTRRRQHRNRHLRQGTTADGAWWLSLRGTPDDAGRFNAALNPHLDTIFRQARTEGRHEPGQAYAYDALMTMAHHAHHAGGHPNQSPGPDPEPAAGHDTNPTAQNNQNATATGTSASPHEPAYQDTKPAGNDTLTAWHSRHGNPKHPSLKARPRHPRRSWTAARTLKTE